jgi:hypothetical protein
MIQSIIGYLDTMPMIVQLIIILGSFLLVFGFVGVIIYKILKAKVIKIGSAEIDSEVDIQSKPTISGSKTE